MPRLHFPRTWILLGFGLAVFLLASNAKADPLPVQQSTDSIELLVDSLIRVMKNAYGKIHGAAVAVFITLATIEWAWGMSLLALKRAALEDILAELVRRLMFIAFFLFLLLGGGLAFAGWIMDWLPGIALDASGNKFSDLNGGFGILSAGFDLCMKLYECPVFDGSAWDVAGALAALPLSLLLMATAIAILLCFLYLAAKILLLNIQGFICSYAGIMLLGLGGSTWTKDYAVNYLRTMFGIAFRSFTNILVIGIVVSLLQTVIRSMVMSKIDFAGVSVVLSVTVLGTVTVGLVDRWMSAMLQGHVGHGGEIGSMVHSFRQATQTFSQAAATLASGGAGAVLTAARTGTLLGNTARETASQTGRAIALGQQAPGAGGSLASAGRFASNLGRNLASGAKSWAASGTAGGRGGPGVTGQILTNAVSSSAAGASAASAKSDRTQASLAAKAAKAPPSAAPAGGDGNTATATTQGQSQRRMSPFIATPNFQQSVRHNKPR